MAAEERNESSLREQSKTRELEAVAERFAASQRQHAQSMQELAAAAMQANGSALAALKKEHRECPLYLFSRPYLFTVIIIMPS